MSISLPNGSTIHIASGYSTSRTITAVTNADPAVATTSASPPGTTNGDFMEVTSSWSRLTDKIVRVSGVSGSDFAYEGIDTSDTDIYPAGSGTGSVREITGWTQLLQIIGSNSQGGEQQFLNYQLLESDAEKRIPTVKSAGGLTLQVADDPTLAGYILAEAANDDRLQRAVRITLPSGAIILYNAFITLNKTPTLTVNQIMAVEVTLSFLNEPVRYAS